MDEPSGSGAPTIRELEDDDAVLANSEFLTRQEVLSRRARRLRRLAKCYRDHYWSLMEEVRRKHRDYYWIYGKPYSYREEGDDAEERENGVVDGVVNNNVDISNTVNNVDSSNKLGLGFGGSFSWCASSGCKAKAMALTKYCVDHIGQDTKQLLYKGCKALQVARSFKTPENGRFCSPLICPKTVQKSTSRHLCQKHAQDNKKQINLALRRAGAPSALSEKLASKFHFHLVIKEYVHLIQSRRRGIASRNLYSIPENGIASRNLYSIPENAPV